MCSSAARAASAVTDGRSPSAPTAPATAFTGGHVKRANAALVTSAALTEFLLLLGGEVRGGHVPELDERNRIGILAGDGDDLMLTELGERLDAELRAFVELLDQHPGIRQVVETAGGALEG